MTRLFIDGQEIALSSDLELDFYTQNPFFTKNGDYTYDLDIDLNHSGNRMVYQSLNRPDVTKRPVNRQAVLLCGAMVIIRGTEVILSVDNNIAKIQIVAGNSELNYLSAGDKNLRQLDLGIVGVDGNESARLNSCYPQVNHVCCPVIAKKGNYSISDFNDKDDVLYNELQWDTRNGYIYKPGTDMVAQPFLVHCIEQVIYALGYEIEENVLLQDDLACRLIVVNGIKKNSQLNCILPKWKIDDFLTEIEKLFNVLFLVDATGKKVRIIHVSDFYKNNSLVEISFEDLVDNVEKKYEQEGSLYVTYDNVSYRLPSSRWYNYQELSDAVREKCDKTSLYLEELKKYLLEDYPYHLWFEARSGIWLIQTMMSAVDTNYAILEMVDQLRRVENEVSDNQCELKIIPSEIYANNVWLSGQDFGGTKNFDGWITNAVPVIANVASGSTQQYAYQEIENGASEEDTDDSYIYIAIYLGLKPYLYSSYFQNQEIDQPVLNSMKIPHAVVYPWFLHYNRGGQGAKLSQLADENMTLAIKGERGGLFQNYYRENFHVDTKTEYVFRFRASSIYDSKSVFLIQNKKYYCKELHYIVRAFQLDPIVEGTFYLLQ